MEPCWGKGHGEGLDALLQGQQHLQQLDHDGDGGRHQGRGQRPEGLAVNRLVELRVVGADALHVLPIEKRLVQGKVLGVRQQIGNRPALDLEDAGSDGRLDQQAGVRRAVAQAHRLVEMGDHLAGGAVAVGDQGIAVEHIHVVLFAEAQHFLRRGVIVEPGVGVDGQRQYIDVGVDEVLIQRILLLVGGETTPGLHQHLVAAEQSDGK